MAETKTVTDEIFENLKKFGFLPVPVQEINSDAETVRYFGGTFQEFVEVAKALGSKCVFVETLYLEDDEFYYDSGEECDDDSCCCSCKDEGETVEDKSEDGKEAPVWLDPEDLDGMDLALLKPKLDDYNERIGDECGVRLTLPGPDHVQVEIFTDWYNDFATLVDEASEEIELAPKAALKKMQEAFAKENAEDENG